MALRTLRRVARGVANLSGRSTFATAAKGGAAKSAAAEAAVEAVAEAEPSAPDVWSGPGPLVQGVRCEDVIVKPNNESVSRFDVATNTAASFSHERNAIMPFDRAWVMDAKMNKSGIDRR